MPNVIPGLDPQKHAPHALHGAERDWIETNCYVDLWIELLAALGQQPEAMLSFTLTQDFEGDQFTFFKPSLDAIEDLYGLTTGELAMFDTCEAHVFEQVSRGRLVLVEVDGHYLPDTRGVTYRDGHSKTTICINDIEPHEKRLGYFHNATYASLCGDDYDGVMDAGGRTRDGAATLLPYTEFVKLTPTATCVGTAHAEALLHRSMSRRPAANPLRAFEATIEAQVTRVAERPADYFHVYAFNTVRQCGANFELLASHLDWLSPRINMDFTVASQNARAISTGMKTLQFRIARAVARAKPAGLAAMVAPLADHYDAMMVALDRAVAHAAVAA